MVMVVKINSSIFYRLLILLYKGFLLRKRHYFVTASDIIIPVLIASIPAIIQSEIFLPMTSTEGIRWVNDTTYQPYNPLISKRYEPRKVLFAYSPSSTVTDNLMQDSIRLWKSHHRVLSSVVYKALEDAEDLEHYCMTMKKNDDYLVIFGTIFNNITPDINSLPSNLDYTIRQTNYLLKTFNTELKYRFLLHYGSEYSEFSFFLSWQAAVEKTFIQKKMEEENNVFDFELWMQEFPFPGHKEIKISRPYIEMIMYLPVAVAFSHIFYMITLMRTVNEEYSNGSKEIFKMIGMSDFVYWLSTFLNFLLFGILTSLIILVIYKTPFKNSAVFENSNFVLLFIIFMLFIASLILFCFAWSTFFTKAVFGIMFMIVFYCIGYSLLAVFVFKQLDTSYFPLPFLFKFSICIFPFGAILTLGMMILKYEDMGEGVQWFNLYSYDVVPDFNISHAMIGMILSCFVYSIVIWYIDAVWPRKYGVPLPLYFPFTKSYWCGYTDKASDEFLLGPETENAKSDFFEDDPVAVSPGIVIKNISKVFRKGLQTKVAVKNLSLNVYKGQITALLGGNGAGKTTTINILTGLFSPSNGRASINGWNISTQKMKARQSLGICPQHNLLYDTLTVIEHLEIYAALKGVKWHEINDETHRILTMLNLEAEKSKLAKHLSGGAKRRLCLAMAIIGGSEVLFLDEPTSGMDVESRRGVWDALLDMRRDRTIVLTTHSMEEADVLADRIAMMASGRLHCCGSPLYLKKKFGTGYLFHLVKEENFDLNAVRGVIARFVPEAILQNETDGEATFNLISNAHSNFGHLFEEIESNTNSFGVACCGITVTTMEDVFLNIANLADVKVEKTFAFEDAEEVEMKEIYTISRAQRKTRKFGNQLYGLIAKRFDYAKRQFGLFVSQLVLPFVLLCLGLFLINISSYDYGSESSLKLDVMEVYGQTDGFYHSDRNLLSKSVKDDIRKIFQEKNINAVEVNDPEKFVLDYGRKNLADYYKRLIVGGSVEASPHGKLNVTAWFNRYPRHAEPMSLLLMHTAILKTVKESGRITLTNHPLPSSRTFIDSDRYHTKKSLLSGAFITIAMMFLSSSFVLVPIHETSTGVKLLQMMTGITTAQYWLSMFLWDFLISIVVCLFLIVPFAFFSYDVFFAAHSEAIGTAFLMMILYCWSSIAFSYLFSFISKKPKAGFSVLSGISIITGIFANSTLKIFLSPKFRYHVVSQIFTWSLKFLPSFALSSGVSKLFAIAYSNARCETLNQHLHYGCMQIGKSDHLFQCCKDVCGDECLTMIYPITMHKDACGRDVLFLLVDGIVYFSLVLFLESSYFRKLTYYANQFVSVFGNAHQFVRVCVEDTDVLREQERVKNNYERLTHQQEDDDDALVVMDLTKTFQNVQAVDHLTFGVHKKECFGLLGVNGAGKSTVFRMITGDCHPTEGNAFIGNYSLTNDLKEFQSFIGYCPQYDALIDRLSAREMITLFARLRGLSGPCMTRFVNALIKMTDLTEYADKPSAIYSPGNKRKLSVALALIGAPPLLLLDEPTAGVDPVSCSKIWRLLSLAKHYSDAAIVLTTHSMEDSEAFCDRLAIMVKGRFRCLGAIQDLKSKFGEGFNLIIKVKKDQNIPLSISYAKAYIDTNLCGAILKNENQGVLQYHVFYPSLTLSYLFRFMDHMKNKCNLEDYMISDISLEQLFLTFAQHQQAAAS